ncbi:MAG: L,D-transpeptidase [Acidobacteriota bacterium]
MWRPWLLVAVVACHGKSNPPRSRGLAGSGSTAVVAPSPEQPAPPAFPEGTRSLELRRTVAVRLDPGDDAKRIGTVAIDTRVGWTRTAPGRGCEKPWIEIVPHGWICGDHVVPSTKPPYGQEVPHLDRGEIVPGTYGKVTAPAAVTYVLEKPDSKAGKKKKPAAEPKDPTMVADKPVVGSLNVRKYDEISVAGRTYWKISQKDNEYVLVSAVTRHVPSHFAGTRLADDTGWSVPFGFVWPRGGMVEAYTTNKAGGGGVDRELAARTPVPILETAKDKDGKPTAYRIGDAEWMFAADVRVFAPAAPPPYLQPRERWIDVDLDAQILVAYEGDLPVYATLVSSGAKDTPTETGVYRMWLKESEADMKGLNGEDPYSVATVPWTQFFSPEKGLALHTAYWHDQFGRARSHGCINLAPRDARWLYFWSDPQVPPGWTMAAGVAEAPGSIVRIRSAADPNPEPKGYAKKVLELRQHP